MRLRLLSFTALLCFYVALPAHAQITLKVMHYNLLQYGNSCTGQTLNAKDIWLESIANAYQPDVFTVNEMAPDIAYANRIKVKSLKYRTMNYGGLTNQAQSDLANMIFYDPAKLGYKSVAVINGIWRDINAYTLYEKTSATAGDTTFIVFIVAHLKAGTGTANENDRATATQNVMNWILANGADKNIVFMGDCNVYSGSETAYQNLVFNTNTSIRLTDPTGATAGWGSGQKQWLTQSTRQSTNDCGSGGGLDDRFDLMLFNQAIADGTNNVQYVPGSFKAFGNDGTVYDGELNCGTNPIGFTLCSNLKAMSDHLPLVMEISVDNAVAIQTPADNQHPAWQVYLDEDADVVRALVYGCAGERMRIALTDVTGRQLITRDFVAESAEHLLEIPVANLPEGVYFAHLWDEAGRARAVALWR